MKKIFVISGGPCSGKTTLINFLKRKGFFVVEEAARLLVKQKLISYEDFIKKERRDYLQRKIMEKQLELESKIPENVTAFLDRGLIDGIAYYWIIGLNPPEELIKKCFSRNYKMIFILEQLKNYKKDEVRYESYEEGRKIHELIIKAYKMFNFKIKIIPQFSVEKRFELIQKEIKLLNE